MTAAELAQIGIDPAVINAAYVPQQSQPVTANDLATLGAGNPQTMDSSYLTAPIPQPTPQDLAAAQYPSDPNQLISQPESTSPDQIGPQYAPQPSVQQSQDGKPVATTGTVSQDQQQQPNPVIGENGKPTKGFRAWLKENDLLVPNTNYRMEYIEKLGEIYAQSVGRAKQTPPVEMINANGHHFIHAGGTILSADDKPEKYHQVQLKDGTLGQVDPSTGTFTPFKDGSGQIVKGKTSGIDVDGLVNQAQLTQLQQQASDLAGKVASDPNGGPIFGDSYAKQLRAVQAKMAALQNPQQMPMPQQAMPSPSPAPMAAPQQAQAPALDPAAIRQAYKSGQLDKATAVNLLRQHGYQ